MSDNTLTTKQKIKKGFEELEKLFSMNEEEYDDGSPLDEEDVEDESSSN